MILRLNPAFTPAFSTNLILVDSRDSRDISLYYSLQLMCNFVSLASFMLLVLNNISTSNNIHDSG